MDLKWKVTIVLFGLFIGGAMPLHGQNSNPSIAGIVMDQSGAVVPNAEVTLTLVMPGTLRKVTTGQDGSFSFPNIPIGTYQLQATAPGFETFIQRGITLHMNEVVSNPIRLKLGAETQTIEVSANASPLNFQTPVVQGGDVSTQQITALPLEVSGGQRNALLFVSIMPAVNTLLSSRTMFFTIFNGGQADADEGILDGVSIVEGMISQSGSVAWQDFPISPEAAGEVNLIEQNFDPQYGATNSAVSIAVTKAGTDKFHGGGYLFNRNTDFNARQFGQANRPADIENDLGAFIGGPLHLPGFWSGRKKSYFFVHNEEFRKTGGQVKPILTVPTAKMRIGDFTEWPYPIFDPATTAVNPNYNSSLPASTTNIPYTRTQFSYGGVANVIPPNNAQLLSSLAPGWIKWVPLPNLPGILDNYESPNYGGTSTDTDQWDVRGDQYIGDRDHVFVAWHYRGFLPIANFPGVLPPQIDTGSQGIPTYSNVVRLNYDHTFSPTLLNHYAMGFLDMTIGALNVSDHYVTDVPEVAGVFSHTHESQITFGDGFSTYGGVNDVNTHRPTWVINDMATWVKGRHTITFGGEYRALAYPGHNISGGSGSFGFADGVTGLLDYPTPTGNSYASFLLGGVSSGSVTSYTLQATRPQAKSVGLFANDIWKATPKLSVTYGMRWDLYQPSEEAKDQMSFLDPTIPNPGAGNLPGGLVFAGTKWGAASYGKPYPEQLYHRAFGPRIGLAYGINSRTVVRGGFGVFMMQDFYPGWGGGISTQGFNDRETFSASLGGMQPAFLLQNGVTPPSVMPPYLTVSYVNGEAAPTYRPSDANQVPRSEDWNLTVERQIKQNLHVRAAYVGNHGSRLLSQLDPINVLNPSLLTSMGPLLNDQFSANQTTVDGVNQPYTGWAGQMSACAPTVAQALQRFPQYCSDIYGTNENHGWSNYNSLQLGAEERLSHGLWFMANYTWSKAMTTTDIIQTIDGMDLGISPYQKQRNYALSHYDVPQMFNLSFIYDLPFGRGRHWVNHGGMLNRLVGGWQISSVLHLEDGPPITFTSSYCNVPAQFGVDCYPGILPGANPVLMSKSKWDPNGGTNPLFNVNAFQPASTFNYNFGVGAPVSNVRAGGYENENAAVTDNIHITERVNAQLRFEFFNLWNWHMIENNFITDVASPSFGHWNGNVGSSPRNIQMGIRFMF